MAPRNTKAGARSATRELPKAELTHKVDPVAWKSGARSATRVEWMPPGNVAMEPWSAMLYGVAGTVSEISMKRCPDVVLP